MYYENYWRSAHFFSGYFQLKNNLIGVKAGLLSVQLVLNNGCKVSCHTPAPSWYNTSPGRVVIDDENSTITTVLEGNIVIFDIQLLDNLCELSYTNEVVVTLFNKEDCSIKLTPVKQSIGRYKLVLDTTNKPGHWQYTVQATGIVRASLVGELYITPLRF